MSGMFEVRRATAVMKTSSTRVRIADGYVLAGRGSDSPCGICWGRLWIADRGWFPPRSHGNSRARDM